MPMSFEQAIVVSRGDSVFYEFSHEDVPPCNYRVLSVRRHERGNPIFLLEGMGFDDFEASYRACNLPKKESMERV